jgi:hypothetical protein
MVGKAPNHVLFPDNHTPPLPTPPLNHPCTKQGKSFSISKFTPEELSPILSPMYHSGHKENICVVCVPFFLSKTHNISAGSFPVAHLLFVLLVVVVFIILRFGLSQ